MSELKGLIFDIDGTMADNEQDGHRIAFNRAFAEAGLDWHWDETLYQELLVVFGGKERIRFFIDDYLGGYATPAGLDAFIRDLHACKSRHYAQLLQSGAIPLRPGIERLLREARDAGIKLALASTTSPENARALLRESIGAHSIDWFDVIACGDIVVHKKPAPDIYLYVLEQLGLPAGECMAIEDSGSGLASAAGAGLKTVVTVNSSTWGHDFGGATLVVDQLGEPGSPVKVLLGDAFGAELVDLGLLRRLHSH